MSEALNKLAVQFYNTNRENNKWLHVEVNELKSLLIAIILQEQANKNDYDLGLRVYNREKMLSSEYELTFKEDTANRCVVIGVINPHKKRKEALAKLTEEDKLILGVS
jgi:hypothetical protein